jgi:hypothetical protein
MLDHGVAQDGARGFPGKREDTICAELTAIIFMFI